MKAGQYFALATGIVYVLLGVTGFIPGLKESAPIPDTLGLTSGYGNVLGLFPVNDLHNIVHLLVGILGIFASISLGSARLYSGMLAISYGLLAVAGLIPVTNTTFGLMPIFGNNVWFNALTAGIALYFGFIATPDLLELASTEGSSTPSKS